jgi:diketogulonate reductase-like aldo/keto reductase
MDFFKELYTNSRIKPKVLQNRFYDTSGFDVELRAFCKEHGILYQSFWTLTANRQALGHPIIKMMATKKGLTPQTLMYAFMMSLGHTPLDGTTSKSHMVEDIAVMERIQGGEKILDDAEMLKMAKILGIPESL